MGNEFRGIPLSPSAPPNSPQSSLAFDYLYEYLSSFKRYALRLREMPKNLKRKTLRKHGENERNSTEEKDRRCGRKILRLGESTKYQERICSIGNNNWSQRCRFCWTSPSNSSVFPCHPTPGGSQQKKRLHAGVCMASSSGYRSQKAKRSLSKQKTQWQFFCLAFSSFFLLGRYRGRIF